MIEYARFIDPEEPAAGVAISPEGYVVVAGNPRNLVEWWLQEMGSGRLALPHPVPVSLAHEGWNEIGVWFNDATGSTHVRIWRQVHADLGAAISLDDREPREPKEDHDE